MLKQAKTGLPLAQIHAWGHRRILPPAVWLCLALILANVSLMTAQVTTADVVGTATDASGAVLPGVKVLVRNTGTGLEYSAVTDNTGNYLIRLLPPGSYTMRAEAPGFKVWTASSLVLAAGDRLRQDIRMEVGEVTQTIEVTAESPALQTESSTVGSLVTERAVQDLPLNGRNFINLVQLAAGAIDPVGTGAAGWATGANPDDRRRSSAVSVNAQPGTANNYLLDGMDNNERFIGSLIVKPSIEAIAEMRVQSSMYSAEVGRVSGGVMNIITKSGTNDFHGSLFEFFRNEKLDASNFFARGARPPYKQNQFGGSLGGPILRNRTFFFGDFEEYRVTQGQTFTNTVPFASLKQGNFAGVANIFDPASTRADSASPTGLVRDPFPGNVIPQSVWDPVGAKVVGLYPDPQTSAAANNYTMSPPKRQTDDTFDVRIDHRFSDSDILFARYSFNDTSTTIPPSLPVDPKTNLSPVGGSSFAGSSLQRSQNATLSETHTFTPRLVGEFKFAFARMAVNSLPVNQGTNAAEKLGIKNANINNNTSHMPRFNITGYQALGDYGYIPLITFNNLFQPAANLFYNRGGHGLKLGADLRRRQVAQYQSSFGVGTYTFNQYLTNNPAASSGGHAIASLLLGYPASTTRSLYLVFPGYRILEYAVYMQDDWRVAPWLTLNLGVRYEYFSPISEAYNRISNFDFEQKKIVIAKQGGVSNTAGVKPDRNDISPRLGFAANFARKWVVRGGFAISYNPPFMGSDQAFRNPPFSSLYTVTTSTPGYPANRLQDGLPIPVPGDPANPSGSLSAVGMDNVTPHVKQFNLTVQRELPWGLVGTASYVGVLGRNIALSVGRNEPAPGPGNYNQRRPLYSLYPNLAGVARYTTIYESSYHALQANLERRFSRGFGVLANYSWSHALDNGEVRYYGAAPELRLVKGNGAADIRHRFTLTSNYRLPFEQNVLAKNWQLNVIMVLQSGIPQTVTNSVTTLNGGGPSRANIVGNPVLPRSQRTLGRWFNTSAFAAPPNYVYGDSIRGAFAGPGKVNFDLSLHREFNFLEHLRAQFRAEAFNITNTPQFGSPGTALGTSNFGVISSAAEPRRVQLALKLLF